MGRNKNYFNMTTILNLNAGAGRTTKIKASPGTTLAEVRSQACEKLNLTSSLYSIQYGNPLKDLDLSLTIRFANLPNNAKLILNKKTKSELDSQSVVVRLQGPTGACDGTFSPSTSLWNVLVYFGKEGKEKDFNEKIDDSIQSINDLKSELNRLENEKKEKLAHINDLKIKANVEKQNKLDEIEKEKIENQQKEKEKEEKTNSNMTKD